MLRKPWFRYLAAALAVLVVLAIATPFVANVVVRQQLETYGVGWKKIARDGFQWRITGFSNGALSAKQARLTLSSKPSLALRSARVDLHQLLMGPVSPPSQFPDWLYVSADPATLAYGDHAIATGLRARLAKGRLVASGPTMNVKGRWEQQLDLTFDGDVVIGEGKFDGVARLRLARQIEMQIMEAKFADGQNHKVFASDVSAELTGASIGRLGGSIVSGKTEGKLDVSCCEKAQSCRLDIQPAGHPFALMLTAWPRSDVEPVPVEALKVAHEFNLRQLSRAR